MLLLIGTLNPLCLDSQSTALLRSWIQIVQALTGTRPPVLLHTDTRPGVNLKHLLVVCYLKDPGLTDHPVLWSYGNQYLVFLDDLGTP